LDSYLKLLAFNRYFNIVVLSLTIIAVVFTFYAPFYLKRKRAKSNLPKTFSKSLLKMTTVIHGPLTKKEYLLTKRL